MVLGVIRLKSESFDPWNGVKEDLLVQENGVEEYLLVEERRMWYRCVAAAIWENGIYDIENITRSHNDLKILGHWGPILGHFRSFCEILGFLGQKPNFRFFLGLLGGLCRPS